MSEDFSEIRPKSVPLSHSATATQSRPSRSTFDRIAGAAIAALILGLGVVVFLIVPDLVKPPQPAAPAQETVTPAAPQTPAAAAKSDELPPFQMLLKQQARQKAQEELARFVELQLQLEQQMRVGEWGQADYDNAKLLATAGDEYFVKEEFDASIDSYARATAALAALIETGERLFGEAMAKGLQALNGRDPQVAMQQFELALTIDPKDPDALRGKQRAELLPQVITAMRQAKNYELAGNYAKALEVYDQVRNLDPETYGLDVALSAARQGLKGEQIKERLSVGFSALDRGELSNARQAFQAALALEPGNPVALGGLEQTAEQTATNRIESLRQAALAAEQREDWDAALEKYAAVLKSDANIQFAREGRRRATAQKRSATALARIIAAPEKLSSSQLFSEAQALLTEAKSLSPRGPQLSATIETVESLINAYREPIAVTFVSDNATQVTLSTVGELGSFERKELNLRPGAYTVIGSQDGCRDVREDIVVRPNMKPVEIRCLERL